MDQSLIVRGAPQEYECREGAWEGLQQHLTRRKLKNVLILHGKASWLAAKPFFPAELETKTSYEYYGGCCTDKRTMEVAKLVEQKQFDGIIAVGGGKVADLGKAAAYVSQVPILILPTLAATCAAYTPLSVMYNQDGSMDRFDIFPVSNALVLIEPAVILDSPKELMVAGIGDTLAKWYEANSMIAQLEILPIEIQVALFAAKKCRDVLLANGQLALDAMEKKELNQAFLNVIETNILLGGMVGGFGDEYGRTSGAHSVHDALTIMPESHHQLHGNKVAYGIFVQLVIENKWQEIDNLLSFYKQLGLPTSLKDMNMAHFTATDINKIAERATVDHETIHFMKETITAEIVANAINDLEKYIEGKTN